jgi:hypothetical protein
MKNFNTRTIAALATLALAGAAFGQSAQSGGGGFDQPLTTKKRSAQTQPKTVEGRTTMMMRQQDGSNDYELRIEGDDMSAKVNGKAVPEDRLRKRGQTVEILDENGDVAARFQVGTVQGRRSIHDAPIPPQPPQGMAIPMAPAAPLKVMLGVNMSQPGEDLREELDLDEGEGVLVDRVIEGLPAAKAGLKQGDVIIEFDGERPVKAETVREVLSKKDVGDTINVTVLREGESRRLKVKLAAYDPSKFGTPGAVGGRGGPGGIYQVQPLEGLDQEQMQKLMEEHMKHFNQGGGAAGPRVWGPNGEQGMRFFVPGGNNAETDAKMDELEARMKELDKKLQRLSEQLTRLQKQLEKSGE